MLGPVFVLLTPFPPTDTCVYPPNPPQKTTMTFLLIPKKEHNKGTTHLATCELYNPALAFPKLYPVCYKGEIMYSSITIYYLHEGYG